VAAWRQLKSSRQSPGSSYPTFRAVTQEAAEELQKVSEDGICKKVKLQKTKDWEELKEGVKTERTASPLTKNV
jgi:hypothetical protein